MLNANVFIKTRHFQKLLTQGDDIMEIEVKNGYLEQNEIDQYVAYLEDKFPNSSLKSLNILLDGEFVDLDYVMQPKKFERIRRITGYLVGTVDRFNDAKKAEESQRVKHDM